MHAVCRLIQSPLWISASQHWLFPISNFNLKSTNQNETMFICLNVWASGKYVDLCVPKIKFIFLLLNVIICIVHPAWTSNAETQFKQILLTLAYRNRTNIHRFDTMWPKQMFAFLCDELEWKSLKIVFNVHALNVRYQILRVTKISRI